jgi:hypothetical protein
MAILDKTQIAKHQERPIILSKLIANGKPLLQAAVLANLEMFTTSAAAIAATSLGSC